MIINRQSKWLQYALGAVIGLPAAAVISLKLSEYFLTFFPSSSGSVFRLGNLALSGFSKAGDIPFAVSFIFIVSISSFLIHRNLNRNTSPTFSMGHVYVLSFPSLILLAAMVFSRSEPFYPLEKSTLFTVFLMQLASISYVLISLLIEKFIPKLSIKTEGISVIKTFVISMAPFAAVGLNFFVGLTKPDSWQYFTSISALIGTTLVFVILFSTLDLLSTKIFFPIQVLLIAGMASFALLPPLLLGAEGPELIPGIKIESFLIIGIFICIFLLLESIYRVCRYRDSREVAKLLPSSVVALFIVIIRSVITPPVVPNDYYHFGELIAPAQQWITYGLSPYTDVYLPRGFIQNILPELANYALASGESTTLSYVSPYLLFGIVLLSITLLRSLIGIVYASLGVMTIAVSNFYLEGDLFVISIYLFVVSLLIKQIRFGIPGFVFALGSTISILSYPLMGFAGFGMTGFIFIAFLIKSFSSKTQLSYTGLNLFTFLLTSLLIILSPLRETLIAEYNYLVNNAGANSEAYGISYQYTWQTQNGIDWLFGLLFLLTIPVTIYLLFEILSNKTSLGTKFFDCSIAVAPSLFALILSSRFLGRIDPVMWSPRPIFGTLLVLGLLLPSFLLMSKVRMAKSLAKISIGFSLIISFAAIPPLTNTNVESALGNLAYEDDSLSKSFSKSIPILGAGSMTQEQAEYLKSLSTFNEIIEPGSQVLNLTNYGALYSFMEWKLPIPYLAPYNIESSSAEEKVIQILDQSNPEFALVGPGNWFDGGSLSMRTPLLSEWLQDKYFPFTCIGNVWAINKENVSARSDSLRNICGVENIGNNPELWQSSIGAPENLAKAPAYWGAGIDKQTLTEQQIWTKVGNLTWESKVPVQNISFLLLTANCQEGTSAKPLSPNSHDIARVNFVKNYETIATLVFGWGNGDFVIPISGYPVLSPDENIKIEIEISSTGCSLWDITTTSY